MQMSNPTAQTALFFDVFLYFLMFQSILALISLNKVLCLVYDFGWPVLGVLEDNLLIKKKIYVFYILNYYKIKCLLYKYYLI